MAFIGSALLDPVCERVINFAFEEYKLVRNVNEEVKKLSTTVSLVNGVLQDAEERQVKEENVRTWLRSLKQVLYDAEDVLDEAATDAALERRGSGGDSRSVLDRNAKVCSMICCFGSASKVQSSHKIARQIRDIRKKLDDISKDKDSMGLQVLVGNGGLTQSRARRLDTDSLLADESHITGRDDDKEEMIRKLLASGEEIGTTSEKNNVNVLVVAGMGGVGKTTLVKLVFNHPTVKAHFELFVWVCVSEDFDLKRITKEIMNVAATVGERKELHEMSNWDLVRKSLRVKIEDKKFLLVLDDVWEEEPSKWDSLLEPLKYGGKGSKIIVTTRNQRASEVVKGTPILLKPLSSENLWPIFKKYAFDGCDSNKLILLEPVGRQIVERLKGSPLAAKTIGRLLNSNWEVKYWNSILTSEMYELQQHESDILPILKLSYNYLPGYLKQCFAYCSMFPKDYEFSKDELVQLWMAQNFIQTVKGFQTVSVGSENSFDELWYKSFFERRWRSRFVMHDLIHDLAETVSMNDCLRLGGETSKEISETVHHVSIVTNNINLEKLMDLCDHKSLRTLLFLHGCGFDLTPHLNDVCMKLNRLRVLGLSDCRIKELPTKIGILKHLRFVDLSRNPIKKLPESFCKLHNLQVLKLTGCESLGALPGHTSRLTNLRHLDARHELVSSVQGLGRLTALQELRVSGRKIRELGDMGMLRQLRIWHLDEVESKEEAVQARLDAKEHLDVLELHWDYIGRVEVNDPTLEEEVLEGLRPVGVVRQLTISGYGGARCPSWMEDHSWLSSASLERVELDYCRNWEVMPALGRLPCLKDLLITGAKSVRQIGPRFFGCCAADEGGGAGTVKVQGFPSLEELRFHLLGEWEEWEYAHGEEDGGGGGGAEQAAGLQQRRQAPLFLPRLRVLEIGDCPKLKELPPLPPTLTELTLRGVGLTRLPGWWGCRSGGAVGDHQSGPSSSSLSPPSLSSLRVEQCPNLTSLGDGLLQSCPLPNLVKLTIYACQSLASLPDTAFRHLTSLKKLRMRNCPSLISWPPSVAEDDALPSSLLSVVIHGCGVMMAGLLRASLQKLTSLSHLDVDGGSLNNMMAGFRELASLTPLPSSLEGLSIEDDQHLDDTALLACLRGLTSLRSLHLSNCRGLTMALPAAGDPCGLTRLEFLDIKGCQELRWLGGSHALVSVEELVIDSCPKLLHLVGGGGAAAANSPCSSPLSPPSSPSTAMLISLRSLAIRRSSPQQMKACLLFCPSLQRLFIGDCPLLTCFDEEEEEDDGGGGGGDIGRELEAALLTLAPALRSLTICGCPNLRCLPSKLRDLSSLQNLYIRECPNIRCWPKGGLPESLESLIVAQCPALKERYDEQRRPHWPPIS